MKYKVTSSVKPTNSTAGQKGRGHDPLNDLSTAELEKMLKDKSVSSAVKQKIRQILKFRNQRNKRKRNG